MNINNAWSLGVSSVARLSLNVNVAGIRGRDKVTVGGIGGDVYTLTVPTITGLAPSAVKVLAIASCRAGSFEIVATA